MPAAAVASLTPAIAGISGTSVGASGETADDMGQFQRDGRDKPGHDVGNYYLLGRSDSEFLLLRRRHLGVGGFGRVRLGVGLRRVGGGLVHALDLGALAQ